MITTTSLPEASVESQTSQIVASGEDVRARLTEVVSRAAAQPQQSGEGLLGLVRAVIDGARAGLDRAVPEDRDDVLRQVVEALGGGLSRAALAGQLAVEEAVSSSRHYTTEDLARLRDDLKAVQALFAETVGKGLSTCKALTGGQVASAAAHAGRVGEELAPAFARVFDAIRQHPVLFAREGVHAGVSAGQGAAGSFFQALGRMLQRAGDRLKEEGRG